MHPLSEIRIRASLYPPAHTQPPPSGTTPTSREAGKSESQRAHHQHRAGCHPPVMVIAQCNDCTLQSLHNAVTRTPHPLAAPPAGDQTLQRTTQRLRLAPPTSRQANKSKNQQIDKLASWRAHHQHRAGCARHLQGLTIYPCRPCRAPPPAHT